jgi:hypothetical protein
MRMDRAVLALKIFCAILVTLLSLQVHNGYSRARFAATKDAYLSILEQENRNG